MYALAMAILAWTARVFHLARLLMTVAAFAVVMELLVWIVAELAEVLRDMMFAMCATEMDALAWTAEVFQMAQMCMIVVMFVLATEIRA